MNTIQKIFGSNLWARIWGVITLLSAAIATKPAIIGFIPASWQEYVVGFSGFIAFVTGGAFVASVKGANTTGGTIANSNRDEAAEDINQSK